MKKLILFLTFLLTICSCSLKGNEKGQVPENNNAIKEEITVVLPNDSNIVYFDLSDGFDAKTIKKQKSQLVYLVFDVKNYRHIEGAISSPDPDSNVRFSQIFLPTGDMDGPFGGEIQYDLPVDGRYKLSVHENMMAGDPWEGVFTVTLRLTNQ